MQGHDAYPRVTYTNIGADFTGLHAMLDRAIPAYRAKVGQEIANIVGGKPETGDKTYEIRSPIDSKLVLATCHEASPETVRKAVAAARAAFPGWAHTPWTERVRIMEDACARLAAIKYDLGIAALLEVGKSRFEAIGEAEEALDIIPFYAEEMRKNEGYHRTLAAGAPGEATSTRLRPIGVFGVIGPFNFPIAVPINMISSALITGNTVVYKPSAGAALTASIVVRCFLEAGLPKGALNLVCGGDETGQALIASDIDGAAFTGSTAAGRAIHAKLTSGPWVRPVIAEMGGKNPAYVTKSADLDVAAEGLARSAFGLQGQKCSSCEVAYIEDSIYADLVAMLRDKTAKMKVGNPEDRDTFVGPLIDEAAGQRYDAAVREARKDGNVVFGGARLAASPFDRGIYVQPLIVDGLPPDHGQVRNELFLPYLSLQRFSKLGDALKRGNAVHYGLCAGFYGRDKADLELFLDQAEAGVLYANRRSGATTGAWPGIQTFGGWKNSGLTGRNGFGPHYLPQFMREQSHTLMKT
jgi:1-pyrroline-5-carboxylate dehydrogenase